ncbi:hypothetical protein GUY44_17125 [Pimelobacter simplex]|uniref:Uncharacterized protein n=1 Tax=Nocardioides simplex TaxID=2045 RepID=A0A0A1DK96_NOCSI|nr:hypothetical protein [Pimelobacter simplex]AIY17022.1 hypothetical protein KR76_10130 [Pimelobacter simplex]MCG8152215.1 hypothetical protein [Pimelobacter simplex]GEB12958.1 hypothetical protein NSI01_12730 [Pimelobacter simplex]SFM51653.1 hypothetical protein SAMN05421671_2072 [Pimelobacter simplex]
MFNRPRSGDRATQAAAAFDDVLAELQGSESAPEAPATPATPAPTAPPTAPPSAPPSAPPAEPPAEAPAPLSVTEHAATLRATRDAQQQAQEMLTMAAQARNDATEQAEQIVVEATDVADRVRADAAAEAERTRFEAIEWVKAQRARVEVATDTLTKEAERDAENIRTEAMRAAMAEAEQTARLYVGEAAARGARDAEEIRGRAREVLHQAADLGTGLQSSMADVAHALDLAMAAVKDQLQAIDALLEETRRNPPVPVPEPEPAKATEPEPEPEPEAEAEAEPETETTETTESTEAAARSGRQLGAIFRGESDED